MPSSHRRPRTLINHGAEADKASRRPSSSPAPSTAPPPLFYHTLVLHSQYQSAAVQSLRTYMPSSRIQCIRSFCPIRAQKTQTCSRVLKRVDVTDLLRPSSSNSESARALRAHNPQRRGDLNHPARCAGGHSYCVSSLCVLSRLFPFRCLTVLHIE
ncbi:hypothetical protein B0H13DRAFT_796438 [Mycena leptocephala]|nr:hypothetical protein B0H13DRAFT_796438 [Mycena leptocephala]